MAFGLQTAQAVVDTVWHALRPRTKAVVPGAMSTVDSRGGWFGLLVRESFSGAWQQNITISADTALTYSAVYRCVSLISSDVAKLRVYLAQIDSNGIWSETTSAAFSPVLRKPNGWQNRIQFFGSWMQSKLINGNTYVLKERDQRNVVVALYVLDPGLVTVLVAPDGAVYYELQTDALSGITQQNVTVPASEMIHDRYVSTFNHPLIGISPLSAAGLAAAQGLRIQNTSTQFFANGARPSGVLSAPGQITEATAQRLKDYWQTEYSGSNNIGKVAVLGDGLTYSPMAMSAEDSQLIEQLKWTAETVASVFGVPAYKIGVGPMPTYNNVEALDSQYYSQCLQIHIEQIELCLDEGLGLAGSDMGTVFDLNGLLRMDTETKVRATSEAIKAGFMAPNEARAKFDLKPVDGGESPYLQIQNYSLKALAKRDETSVPTTPGVSQGQASPKPTPAPAAQGDTNAAARRAAVPRDLGDRIERAADRHTRRAA